MAKIAKPDLDPRANKVYGELCEDLHFAGYGFERGCQRLRKLLSDDSWRQCGNGFTNVDEFLTSLRLDDLAKLTEERREIAKLIKAARPEATTRAIATALGSKKSTVHDDLSGKRTAGAKTTKENSGGVSGNRTASGAEAAKLIARKEEAPDRRDERLEKIAEISKGNTELGTSTRYPIIYADPPWRYENPPMGGGNRSIENHYPTMTLEELIALPVAKLAADDSLLYLWATAPKLAECIDVLRAWGFEYRTNGVWDKELIGMGYHFRNQHELLLVGKRGEIPPPPAGEQPSSVHRERRAEHSAKPEFYYEMIEAAYPQLQKIELFRRSVDEKGKPIPMREGWAVWGNQAAPGVAA
jgi:N6-adenosine-specific RNA methylase IME4